MGESVLGAVALAVSDLLHFWHVSPFAWALSLAFACFLLLNAAGMVSYSRWGKRRLRERALAAIHWRGDERVLDVGCGRGLMVVAAARRLTTGRAVGVDRWVRGAVSGNRAEAVVQNAALEGVAERVEVVDGDARELPFADATFDVVVSNFVVHELDTQADRERMLREVVRVLKPDGQMVLVDFIFTGAAVQMLRASGVSDARRVRIGSAYDWCSALLLSFGVVRLYAVVGTKDADTVIPT
jgi:ubiquinone/menaquinone biosynthesis C-methylase UbiE